MFGIVPGVLVLHIDSPIYFSNASYLRERISRWIDDEQDRINTERKESLRCVVLDMGAVSSIDSSGTKMLDDVNKSLGSRGIQIALANLGSEVMKKLDKSKVLEIIGNEWVFLTVSEACDYVLQNCKIAAGAGSAPSPDNMV